MTRTPSHSVEAEQAVLGGLMLDPSAYQKLSGILKPEHFHDFFHQTVATLMWEMFDNGRRPTPITLCAALPGGGEDELQVGVTVREYLVRMATRGATDTIDMGIVVSDLAARRQALTTLSEAMDRMYQMPAFAPLDEVLAQGENGFYKIRDESRASRMVSMYEATKAAAGLAVQTKQGGGGGMCFGLRTLDNMFGLMQRGDVVGICAPSGSGKTALALQIVMSNLEPTADEAAPSFLFIEQEMTEVDMAMRAISRMGGPTVQAMRTGKFNASEEDTILEATAAMQQVPIFMDTRGRLRLKEIRSQIKAAKRRYNIRAAVIDHLQLIEQEKTDKSEFDVIREASNAFKAWAKEEDITLIVLAQLSKGAQKEMRHWRFSSDAIWGGDQFRQACDIMIGVTSPANFLAQRPPAYDWKDDGREEAKVTDDIRKWQPFMEVGGLKTRHGVMPGWRKVKFDGDRQWFEDLA